MIDEQWASGYILRDMLGEWSKSPGFKAVVVLVIVGVLISFFKRGGHDNTDEVDFDKKIHQSVGMMAAERAAKILGTEGGDVALILLGTDESKFKGSESEPYEEGFRVAAEKAKTVRLAGHFLVNLPILENGRGYNFPTLRTLQAAREKYPSAKLLVCFLGLPVLKPDEEKEWQASSPPKMIIVQGPRPLTGQVERYLQEGLAHAVFLFRAKAAYPEKKPTDLHEIFQLFYEVVPP